VNYDLTRPCASCPFRTDRPFALHPERGREIMQALDRGGTFQCHKTVDYAEDSEAGDEPRQTPKDQHCAGALLLLEHEGRGKAVGGTGPGCVTNQQARFAARFGMFDPDKLDGTSPVYRTRREWFKALEALARKPAQHKE
jgi:hypothetical protein